MKVLSIIPARGGSKGLPGKNIRPLAGHPLIAYSILASANARLVDKTLCSTDSEEIAAVARSYGAEVPFLRPNEISGDFSTDIEFIQHAVEWYAEHENYHPDYIVQLRPTSPIRPVGIIDGSIARLEQDEMATSLRVVTKAPLTPYKMWRVSDDESRLEQLLYMDDNAEPFNSPRQKLPQIYWQIGILDVIKTETITKGNSVSGHQIIPHIVDQSFAIDIDDIASFEKAAAAMEQLDCYNFNNFSIDK